MMLNDIKTVMWKERKSLFRVQVRRSQLMFMLVTPIFLAIVIPLQLGKDWLETGFSVLIALVIPILMIGTTVPAAFAGEREHHTLPTLLASRLPDRAILFGKILTALIFGWGMTLGVLLLSMVTANLGDWDGQFHFYKLSVFFAAIGTSLFMSVFTASAGVLFSLRADSIQGAQQSLMAVLMIPPMILQMGLFLLLGSPAGKQRFRELTAQLSFEQVMVAVSTVLLVLALTLLLAAMVRFKRERLIL